MAKQAAYQKDRQSRFGIFMVAMVVMLLSIVVAVKGVELKQKLAVNQAREASLQEQIQAEEQRALEIEEYGKEIQTKKYVEQIAKEKLGLVYEGEIVFKENE